MAKINLRGKFLFYFSPLILCVFTLGAYCAFTFSTIYEHFSRLHRDLTPNAVAMLELKDILLSLESGIKTGKIDRELVTNNINKLRTLIVAHPDHRDVAVDPAEKAAHDMMHHAIRTMSLSEYILRQSEAGWNEDMQTVSAIINKELQSLGPVLDEHLKIHLRELTKTEALVTKKYQQTLIVVALTSVLVILFTCVILMAMMRSVLGPVSILQEGARQIGEGHLDFPIAIRSGDEFEFLAREFRKMAAKLSEYHADLDHKVRERTQELQNANLELRRAEEQVHQLSQELLKIQETERQKIALDLHDHVAQELSSLKIASESMGDDLARGKVPQPREISDWVSLLDRCIKTVRELSYNLRPPGLEQIGIVSVVRDYCRNFARQHGLRVDFAAAGLEHLSLDYECAITIYRLIQEALNNIQKHAKASAVEIRLTSSHPNLILRVEDDGRGFDPQEASEKSPRDNRMGLLGMRERVRMLQGRFSIKSVPRQGTRIFIEIPLQRTSERDEENPDS